MSASYLFAPGTNVVDKKYLPPGAVNPTLEEVLADGNDGGANDMILQQALYLPSADAPSITLNGEDGIIQCASLEVLAGETVTTSISGGGEILTEAVNATEYIVRNIDETVVQGIQSDPQKTDALVLTNNGTGNLFYVSADLESGTARGQIYDTHYNPPPAAPAQIRSAIIDLSGSTVAGTLGIGSQVVSHTCTTTGLYCLQFGWELGTTGGTGVAGGASVSIYDNADPASSVLAIQSYKNTGSLVFMDAAGMSITTDIFQLNQGTTYDFRYAIAGSPLVLSTDNTGEWFFKLIFIA